MNSLLLFQSIREFSRSDFSRSGGPGGQNVNKVNTRVILRIKISDIKGLNEEELTRLRETLTSRITNEDELIVTSSEERSQRINLERAYVRLENLISNASKINRKRRPTKPSSAQREERLLLKRKLSQKKDSRRFRIDD